MRKTREVSYGQCNKPTIFDRFGVYLSSKRLMKELVKGTPPPGVQSKYSKLIDLGAGFNMKHSAELAKYFDVTAVDVALNQQNYPNIKKIEGSLSDILPTLKTEDYSVVLLNSVLEHIAAPQEVLIECFRVMSRGGIFYVSVPTWKGKFFLEYTAFELKHEQARYEMNDHKMYYDKKDLWPMLVKAGFLPETIRLSYYKFGLNLLGICRKEST